MNDLWDASSDRRTAAVLASLSDAIVVTDPAGTILRLNPVAERLIGRGSDELAGSEPPYDYWPAEDVERLLELVRLADCEEEGAPPPWIDTAYAHVSGRRVPVRVTVCCHMRYSLHIAAPPRARRRPGAGRPARAGERVETDLRNIAWGCRRSAACTSHLGAPRRYRPRSRAHRASEVLGAFIQGWRRGHRDAAPRERAHGALHLKVIYRKMGVRSKTELMRRIARGRRLAKAVSAESSSDACITGPPS